MRTQHVMVVGVMVAAVGVVSLAGARAGGEAQTRSAADDPAAAGPESISWSPALLPDGQPDMQGIYVPNWGSAPPSAGSRKSARRMPRC